MWCIPPEQDADFVFAMENVLEVYRRPYDERHPVVCMDEKPRQLVKEMRRVIPARQGQAERYDYEYERNGMANIFLCCEPLGGWRGVEVTERRTKLDWAEQIRHLVDQEYPRAKKITLVMDNLNTHTLASLYEAYPPEKARRLVERLEVVYTPKHGSWLNVAEVEFAAMEKQCLWQRMPDATTLHQQVKAWEGRRNNQRAKVKWQFTTGDARVRLHRLYPQIQP